MPPEVTTSPRPAPGREILRRLRWPLHRRLGAQAAGDERSGSRGPGIEYADVHEYQPPEDARLIDWNLTARSDRPYVRESHQERGLDIWLLVDASRSLDWGTVRSLKKDASRELVDLLALLLARHGNRVGAVVFDTQLRRILPLTAGRAGRLGLVSSVEGQWSLGDAPGGTDLVGVLQATARLIRRPSLVLVISDFLVGDGWQHHLRALALRHEVVAVRVSDPSESELPSIGLVTFEDPETGSQLEVDTGSARLRQRYRVAAAAKRARLVADLETAHAQLLEVTTAEPVITQLVAYLRERQVRRGPRGPVAS